MARVGASGGAVQETIGSIRAQSDAYEPVIYFGRGD